MTETLVSMLAEACDMERKTIEILEERADRIRSHPAVVERFKRHIKETSWQIAQLEQALRQLEADPAMPSPSALGDVGVLLASGDVIRNSIANSAFERFEMAVYARLAAAAEQAGEHELSRICGTIMRQEETMAEWLEENLPQTPLVYLMFDDIQTPPVNDANKAPHAPAGPLS